MESSDSPFNFQKQIVYFEKHISLALQNSLPVVVHSRGNAEIQNQTLTSLSNILPSTHPIHWHCFTGSVELYKSAVDKFSNIVFGITPFVFSEKYPNIHDIIHNFGVTNLVLESDAPYIPFKSTPGNPYLVHFVAEEISKICCIPVESVFKTTTENCKRIYKLN